MEGAHAVKPKHVIPAKAGIQFLLSAVLLLSGCAEFYRWPDRMNRPAEKHVPPLADDAYRVVPGDTVYSIAFRNQLDFRDLAVWNDIGPDYLIKPDQILRLTAPPVTPNGTASSTIRTAPLQRPELAVSAPPRRVEPPLPAPHHWQWPTHGEVVRPYGTNAKGVDISGQLGQPIRAAAPGKVVYSGSALKGYGELIIIKHDDLHLSAYGYNRRRLVEEGTQVAAGQPIAELGLGPEQKPVLHFEVRRRGKPVDPMEFLPDP